MTKRVVALGGGHGLAATLKALRRITDQLTAVVGVADDGGSSGRLRAEFGVLPPGDLRMALAALCRDDTWGQTWSSVIQHRFTGNGELGGHSLGNLLITALWEQTEDAIAGLDWVAALLETQGRVLPCSTVPLLIVADVEGVDPQAPQEVTEVRGQVAVATTPGRIARIRLEPKDPPACAEAIAAIGQAESIVMGPGSWFTSVIPHLLIPDLARAIIESTAQKIVVLNLDPHQDSEMSEVPVDVQLSLLAGVAPGVRIDSVIADPDHVDDIPALELACRQLGASLLLHQVSYVALPGEPLNGHAGEHDPAKLSAVFALLL